MHSARHRYSDYKCDWISDNRGVTAEDRQDEGVSSGRNLKCDKVDGWRLDFKHEKPNRVEQQKLA